MGAGGHPARNGDQQGFTLGSDRQFSNSKITLLYLPVPTDAAGVRAPGLMTEKALWRVPIAESCED
jgi:hypothetical protein